MIAIRGRRQIYQKNKFDVGIEPGLQTTAMYEEPVDDDISSHSFVKMTLLYDTTNPKLQFILIQAWTD